MARRKPRPTPTPPSQTAVATQPTAGGSGAGSGNPEAASLPGPPKPILVDRSWIENVIIRLSRVLGSLQIAVVLLSVFAVTLAVGTAAESWYSTKISQELVYRTWWFGLLMGLLAVNIFFAAAKKAEFRTPRRVGTDIDGKGYLATLGYWWPWLVVVCIFVITLLPDDVSLTTGALIVLASASVLSLILWGVQQSWPIEQWWPWKKHQVGFLVTHVGLLTMVAGGIWNAWAGTDALMVLTDNPAAREHGPTLSRRIVDVDYSVIRVKTPKPGTKEETLTVSRFEPGSLAWKANDYPDAGGDPLLGVLSALANPLPRGWSVTLPDRAELEVLAYFPQARREPFRRAGSDERDTLPALKFQLSSAAMGMSLPEKWLALSRSYQVSRLGQIATVELLGTEVPVAMMKEFLDPPPADQVGSKGQLVLRLGGRRYSFSVDKCLDGPAQTLDNGWKVRVTRYLPAFPEEDPHLSPSYPVLDFELTTPDGRAVTYRTAARLAGVILPLLPKGQTAPAPFRECQGWYHLPDPRCGETTLKAVLQFVLAEDGKLYYRSYAGARNQGVFGFERSGEAGNDNKEGYPIWEGMNWKFRIAEFWPRAVEEVTYVAESLPAGVEREDLSPALRCRLTSGKESKEFWLGKSDESLTTVTIGQQQYRLGYNTQARDLDFDIRLLRAEQTFDPGTHSAASYTSYVQLTDRGQKIVDEDRVITMNQPLNHRGYKFYQSGYATIGTDDNGKPMSRSVFTVGRDPGLWLKYAGSTMLALGIFCMFYMKAYFFKARGKNVALSANGRPGED